MRLKKNTHKKRIFNNNNKKSLISSLIKNYCIFENLFSHRLKNKIVENN
jgi:hypothetical protein